MKLNVLHYYDDRHLHLMIIVTTVIIIIILVMIRVNTFSPIRDIFHIEFSNHWHSREKHAQRDNCIYIYKYTEYSCVHISGYIIHEIAQLLSVISTYTR